MSMAGDDKPPDVSVLRPPIHIGKPGVHQIIECFQTGTTEVRGALSDECDVILECKVCHSMFRALPNFLAHKRVYCLEKFKDPRVGFVECRQETGTIIVEPADPEPGFTEEMDERVDGRSEDHSEEYEFYTKIVDREKWKEEHEGKTCTVKLTPIPGNPNAMKQHAELVGNNVVPVASTGKTADEMPPKDVSSSGSASQKNKSKENKMVIATTPLGKLKCMEGCSVKNLKCLICKITYSSYKSLYRHMTAFHAEKRTVYPCPYCKNNMTQLWGLSKHIMKHHGKSKEQVQKMREKLKKKAIQVKVTPMKKVNTSPHSNKPKESNSSPKVSPKTGSGTKPSPTFANISSNLQLHKCTQCGRSFGKKDSLQRHMPFCMHHKTQASSGNASSKVVNGEKKGGSNVEQARQNLANALQIDVLAGISKEDLKRVHALIDESSQQCIKCDKSFASVSSLHRHAVRHLGWKRFKCALCKFQCYNRSECKSHLQKVHKNIEPNELLTYVLDLEPEEVKCGKSGRDLAEVQAGQSKRSLAFKNKTSPKQVRNSDSASAKKENGYKSPDKDNTYKAPASPRTVQRLDFRGAELSSTTDKMLLATTTVKLEDLDNRDEKKMKTVNGDQSSTTKTMNQDQNTVSKTKSNSEQNITSKTKKTMNSSSSSEQVNGVDSSGSPQVGSVRSKRLENRVKSSGSTKSSPSGRSQSPGAQPVEAANNSSPVSVKTGQKRKAEKQDNLQVLRTRSGVVYKKPSLEEILKKRQERQENGENSDDDCDDRNNCIKKQRKSSPKPSKGPSTPEKKSESSRPSSSRSGSNSRDNSASQANTSPRSKIMSPSSMGQKESPRITSPTNRDPLKTQSFYAKSGLPPGPQKPVVVQPGSYTIVSSPVKSPTASDLIKQSSPLRSRISAMSADRKAFDLSKAKVILSPLASTSSPPTQIKLGNVTSQTVLGTQIVSSSIIATSVTSPPQAITVRPVAAKSSTAVKETNSGKTGKPTTMSSPPGLPRLAPKPLPRPQKSDFVILIDNPRPIGITDVVDAINKSGTKLSADCMYVLKDDQLTAVSRTNPAVSGVSNMGYSFAINTSPISTSAQKVFAITNSAVPPALPLMSTHIVGEKPLTRSGQKGTDSPKALP